MLKKIFFISICLALCACSTTHLTAENTEAAEINAKLALAYLQQEEVSRGKAKLLMAQKQAPQDPAIWYISGYFFEHTLDLTAAKQAYLHAIQLAPNLGAAQNNYGAFLCRQGAYTKAIEHFLSAVRDPDYLGTAGAYENAARCALKIPNQLLADKYFKLAAGSGGASLPQ